MVPTPLILRLRSRPSEIPDRQDVFVVAAGRVVDPGGHPERVDDTGVGTSSREPGGSGASATGMSHFVEALAQAAIEADLRVSGLPCSKRRLPNSDKHPI
jgi:hypothetical protein